MAGKQTPQQFDGKPAGMSQSAWIQLHKLAAKIILNHSEEIREIQASRKKALTG
ncbi:hypothetical protein [Bacillus sp. FSL K6-6540]|uniref:hypothetical protein n=1 Tax=Bacillus sp. FSL K6-6540 TaxID=2921512 RepID=UPI0030F9CEF0